MEGQQMAVGTVPTIQERVEDLMAHPDEAALYACPHPWALAHQFEQPETGRVLPARCDRWDCLYCGPRKVDQWRQLIAAAQPTLHVVLTSAGQTLEQSARALTTWRQSMRRGSKGKGKDHVGARPAYDIEDFAVLEEHADVERVGFHWHLLVKGVDFLDHEHIKQCWQSATDGRSKVCWVERVDKGHAVGYITKYLTKDLAREKKGVKQVERVIVEHVYDEQGQLVLDEQGQPVERRRVVQVEQVSRARRIRYSRHFFPESVKDLKKRLFSQPKKAGAGEEEQVAVPCCPVPVLPLEERVRPIEWQPEQRARDGGEPMPSPWKLRVVFPGKMGEKAYQWRKREVLRQVLEERVAKGKRHNGRVLSIWNIQRQRLRLAG